MRATLPPATRRSIRRQRKGLVIKAFLTAHDNGGGSGRATRRIRVRAKRSP